MIKTEIELLIAKYFSKETSTEENEILKNWVEENDFNRKEFIAYSKTNRQSIDAFHLINGKKTTTTKPLKIWYYVAAASLLIGFFSIAFYYLMPIKTSNEIYISFNGKDKIELKGLQQIKDENNHKIASFSNNILNFKFLQNLDKKVSITVPAGKKMNVLLSDGSIVQINSGTTLRFPIGFKNENKRSVFLDGEALFSVRKNSKKPFFVNTENFVTEVLGTTFNVNSYSEDANKSVTLLEGSVKISEKKSKEQIKLVPGESFTINKNKNEITGAKKANITKDIAWSRNEIIFENEMLQDIFKKIERNYNVKVISKDNEINNKRFSGAFKNQTLESILKTLEISLNCNIQQNGYEIVIIKNK